VVGKLRSFEMYKMRYKKVPKPLIIFVAHPCMSDFIPISYFKNFSEVSEYFKMRGYHNSRNGQSARSIKKEFNENDDICGVYDNHRQVGHLQFVEWDLDFYLQMDGRL
jgi:hypothetical protein